MIETNQRNHFSSLLRRRGASGGGYGAFGGRCGFGVAGRWGCGSARMPGPTHPFPPIAPVGTGARGGNRCDPHVQVAREAETGATPTYKWRARRKRERRRAHVARVALYGEGAPQARLPGPTPPFPPIAPVGTGARGGNGCDPHIQVARVAFNGEGAPQARMPEPTHPFPPIAPVGTGARGGNGCDPHVEVAREAETGAAPSTSGARRF